MLQQNELITFLVGTGAALYLVLNRRRFKKIPGYSWLYLSYAALFSGWTLTLIEGFVLPRTVNVLEHAFYMLSSMSAAAWCWVIMIHRGKSQ